jgi:hypothetical protein
MKTKAISLYFSNNEQNTNKEFEEAFFHSIRTYSLISLPIKEQIPQEKLVEALEKSLKVCQMAGINSMRHFKKIYVYDADIQTVHIDWRMSKRGLNLMLMQIPTLNEQMARWLWDLADF